MADLIQLWLETQRYLVQIPAGSDVCHWGCACTVFQTDRMPGVCSVVYGTMHNKEHLKYLIRAWHSPDFGLPLVAILPWVCGKRFKAIFTDSLWGTICRLRTHVVHILYNTSHIYSTIIFTSYIDWLHASFESLTKSLQFKLLKAPCSLLISGAVYVPASTKHLYNICTTSSQRLRRWSNIVQMLYKSFVFAGVDVKHIPNILLMTG